MVVVCFKQSKPTDQTAPRPFERTRRTPSFADCFSIISESVQSAWPATSECDHPDGDLSFWRHECLAESTPILRLRSELQILNKGYSQHGHTPELWLHHDV